MNLAPKKMPKGQVELQFMGDLVMAKCTDPELRGLFRRFENLFEGMANLSKDERFLNYLLIDALIFTSLAKKATSPEKKKDFFDRKNQIFFEICTNENYRKKCQFNYLISDQFRVVEFCKDCLKRNESSNQKRWEWKFCKKCKLDRKFYNVLSLQHKTPDGYFTIFLSQDLIEKLDGLKFRKGKRSDQTEEGRFKNFQYNAKNMDAISEESALKLYDKLIPKKS